MKTNNIPNCPPAMRDEIIINQITQTTTSETGEKHLSDLSDVTLTTPADGDNLHYDSTSGKWVNYTPSVPVATTPVHNIEHAKTNTATLYFDLLATEDVLANRFITADGKTCENVAYPIGVTESAWTSGETMRIVGSGVVFLEAGTVIHVGDIVYPGLYGKVVNDASGMCIAGTALTAGGIGDLVQIKLTV